MNWCILECVSVCCAALCTKITAVKEIELVLRSLHGRHLNECTHPSRSCCHVTAEIELCLDGVIPPQRIIPRNAGTVSM